MEEFKPFLPENLKNQEIAEISAVESGQDASRGHFGAYHRLLKDRKDDLARQHAIIDRAEAAQYTDQAYAAVESLGLLPPDPLLLDAGCGPGTITEALRVKFCCVGATGIDISQSAIRYARDEFPTCRFEDTVIDERTALPEKYDIIHAREFYPFTRTGDISIHKIYLEVFARHLKPGGILILTLLSQQGTLAGNSERLNTDIQAWGLSSFRRVPLAAAAVMRLLRSITAGRNATWAINTLLRRPQRYFYISQRTHSPR